MTPDVQLLSSEVRKDVAQSNIFLLDTMKELSEIFEEERSDDVKSGILTRHRKNIKEKNDQYKEQIVNSIGRLWRFMDYQNLMRFIRI
jgi:hypothetical protein